MKIRIKLIVLLLLFLPGSALAERAVSPADTPLAGTSWRLVEFQSMDDTQGTTRPADPSLYTMQFKADGTVVMRLNCNRANGTWSAEPAGDGKSGRLEFGPLAMTRALCPPPSMGESIAAHTGYIRSYLLQDGRLFLSLMADGGIYVWQEDPAKSPEGSVAGPDDSAQRAGRGEFDATGTLPCAQSAGRPMGQCEFSVARARGGNATVVIRKPDGRTRAIFFRMGKPVSADTSQADGYPEFKATREKDLNLIRVGEERYEIPDAVVLGG